MASSDCPQDLATRGIRKQLEQHIFEAIDSAGSYSVQTWNSIEPYMFLRVHELCQSGSGLARQ